MESTIYTYSSELMHALSWTLLHSLWQGFIIAIIILAIVRLGKNLSTQAKYVSAVGSLLILFLSSITTFYFYLELPTLSETIPITESTKWKDTIQLVLTEDISLASTISEFVRNNSPLISLSWLIGLSFFILRILFGILQIQRLRNGRSNLSSFWMDKLEGLKQKVSYNKAILLGESVNISSPLTFGFLKPVLLFPVGMVNQLSVEQVEAIMAHELAHIIRKDYLINLLQTFIESVYYFNPSVWIISTIIRNQREHCCDDLAIELTGNNIHYIKALVAVEETNNNSNSILAMALSKNKKPLLNRVKRILNQPQNNENMKEKLLMCMMLFISVLFFSVQAHSKEGTTKSIDSNEDTLSTNLFEAKGYNTSSPESFEDEQMVINSMPLTTVANLPLTKTDTNKVEVKNLKVWINEDLVTNIEMDEVIFNDDITLSNIVMNDVTFHPNQKSLNANSLKVSRSTETTQGGDYRLFTNESGTRWVEKETSQIKKDTVQIKSLNKYNRSQRNFKLITNKTGTYWTEIESSSDSLETNLDKSKLEKHKKLIRKEAIKNRKSTKKEATKKWRNIEKQRLLANSFSRDSLPNFDELNIDEYIREATEEIQSEMENIRLKGKVIQEDLNERFQELREDLIDSLEDQKSIKEEAYDDIKEFKEEFRDDFFDIRQDSIGFDYDYDFDFNFNFDENSVSLNELIQNELMQDGLIDDPDNFSFKIKNKTLSINGKEQSTQLYEKYTAFLNKQLKGTWTPQSKIKITKKNGSNTSSINIQN